MDRRRFFGLSAAAGGLLAASGHRGQVWAQPSGPVYGGAPKLDLQALHRVRDRRVGGERQSSTRSSPPCSNAAGPRCHSRVGTLVAAAGFALFLLWAKVFSQGR